MQRSRASSLSLIGAAAWSAGLLVLAFTFSTRQPPVSRAVLSGDVEHYTSIVQPSQTLIQRDGLGVLFLVALPLVVVCGVALAIRRRRSRQLGGAGPAAWTMAILVCAVALAGAFTIGPLMMPVAVLLTVSCWTVSPVLPVDGVALPPTASRVDP